MGTPDAGGLVSSAIDRMLGAAWPPGRLLMLPIIQCSVSRPVVKISCAVFYGAHCSKNATGIGTIIYIWSRIKLNGEVNDGEPPPLRLPAAGIGT